MLTSGVVIHVILLHKFMKPEILLNNSHKLGSYLSKTSHRFLYKDKPINAVQGNNRTIIQKSI